MSEQKYRKFYVDWWEIKSSTLYGAGIVLFLISLIVGGSFWLWQNNWVIQSPSEEAPANSARIVSYQGDVRIIRVTTRKTERVTQETYVLAGDTIQTQSDGRAQVRMIDGSMLSVRPNSTVVIRDSKSIFGGTSVRVKLDDGQIRVKTEDHTQSSDNIVEVKETENRLASQSDVSFDLNEKANRSEIRINRGSVEAKSGNNKTIINQDEFVALKDGKISTKEQLLKPPDLITPANSDQILTLTNGKSIAFRWKKPVGNSGYSYHLQVAGSPFFVSEKIVVEKTSLSNNNYNSGDLAPGTYYWRVRASSDSGQISEWGEPIRFTIIKKISSAKIEADEWKAEYLGGRLYRVSGKTQPGATVRISGRETFARSDGSFLLQISSNTSTIPVEIYDERGNRGRYNLNLKTGQAR
jgi:hypothetical protein